MALLYLLDENLRGLLWMAVQRHNSQEENSIDVVRVGDFPDLPLGADDPEILLWAEREGRVLVTIDRSTMSSHPAAHLADGHSCPGVFSLRRTLSIAATLDFIGLAAHASEPGEWADRIQYIP